MNDLEQILIRARVAELRDSASSVAELCRPPAVVKLRGDDDRRVLIRLLRRERQRNAKLVSELIR